MNRRSVLFFLGLLASTALRAQDLEGSSVSLKAVTRVSGSEFFIGVQCTGDSIKVTYRSKDSISVRLQGDASYIACRDKLLAANNAATSSPTLMQYAARLDSIRQAYTTYSVSSFTLHKQSNKAYANLLNQLFAASSEALENLEANKGRVVLDGTSMSFTLTAKESSRIVYAQSPASDSHPILYAFVHETLELFRQSDGGELFSAQRTGGY